MAKRGLHGAVGGRSEQAVGARAGWRNAGVLVTKCRSREQIWRGSGGGVGTFAAQNVFQLTAFRGIAHHTVLPKLYSYNQSKCIIHDFINEYIHHSPVNFMTHAIGFSPCTNYNLDREYVIW